MFNETSNTAKIIWFLLVLHWAVHVIEVIILHRWPSGGLEDKWRKLDHSTVVNDHFSACVGAHDGYFEHTLSWIYGSVCYVDAE